MMRKTMVAMIAMIAFGCVAGESPETVCRTSVDAAKKMLELKQVEPAKALLEAALKAKGHDAEALMLRAQIKLDEQNYVGATEDANAAKDSVYKYQRLSITLHERSILMTCDEIIKKADKVNGTIDLAMTMIDTAKKELKKVADEIKETDPAGAAKLLDLEKRITVAGEERRTTTATPKKEEPKKDTTVDPIVGKWKWFNDHITIFLDNGDVIDATSNNRGRWTKHDDTYTLTWRSNLKHTIKHDGVELKILDRNKSATRHTEQ